MTLGTILILAFQLYFAFTILVLLLDNREPAETFAWLFVFVLFPGFGFIIYLIFGRNWRRAYDHKRRLPQFLAKQLLETFRPLEDAQPRKTEIAARHISPLQQELIPLLHNNCKALLTTNNDVKIFHDGQSKFESLKADLRAAQKFIHLEYFIWRSSDRLGRELSEILIAKAGEGVEIRILYDFSGCFYTLKKRDLRKLRRHGIRIYPFFNYLSPLKLHTVNYRNHRKIAVIDGEIGYTGGMNVGQEYIDGGRRYDSWRDTHLRISGEAASILQAVFAIDWYNTTEEDHIFDGQYFPAVARDLQKPGQVNVPVQMPTSGFDSDWPSILQQYFSLITTAKENIYISTPYFIPDASLNMALKTAAMRGVEVILLMTGVPDQKIPYWAAFSYFEELLKSGVRIYQYESGFFHAKILSADKEICSVGTANFDPRSLKLNYEINTLIYHPEVTADIDRQFYEDLKRSHEITLPELTKAHLGIKLRNSLVRLMSPVL